MLQSMMLRNTLFDLNNKLNFKQYSVGLELGSIPVG